MSSLQNTLWKSLLTGVIILQLLSLPSTLHSSHENQPRHYYLAHWEWVTQEHGFEYWAAPHRDKVVGLLDLRPLPAQAKKKIPEGYGFFSYDQQVDIPGSIYLGNSLDTILTPQQKAQIRQSLNIKGPIQSDTIRDILWDILTIHADPSGQTGPKPLTGSKDKSIELHLGGHSVIKREPFTQEHRQRTIAVFQADYRRNRESNAYPLETLQKWTGATMLELWGEMSDSLADVLMPLEYRSDGWETPRTTITDDFNRADNGLGPNWSNDSGTWGILSNQARNTGGGDVARYSGTSLSSADHYAQIKMSTRGLAYKGVAVRKVVSSTLTYYGAYLMSGNNDFDWWKRISGTHTQLQTDSVTSADGDTFKGEINGTTLKKYQNGTQVGADLTDSSISGNLQVAMVADNTDGRYDDFQAADLASTAGRTASVSISSIEVQDVSATSATISWYTFPATNNTRLQGEPAPTYPVSISPSAWHEAFLTNLFPDTLYSYTIQAGLPGYELHAQAYFSFKTNPSMPPPQAPPPTEQPAHNPAPQSNQSPPQEPQIQSLLQQIQELKLKVIELSKQLIQMLQERVNTASLRQPVDF